MPQSSHFRIRASTRAASELGGASMDILRLKGLQFYGRHGTEVWEKQTGCRFEVDLELGAEGGGGTMIAS